MKLALLTTALLALAACGHLPPQTQSIPMPTNPAYPRSWVSPCAGGQPEKQYNCPQN
ncbi:MAG: hypothetical protein J2P47_11840 [Acetobacteraceae bacterium]|nr:hypothetical protein [Acetobacteraceae bacterium]